MVEADGEALGVQCGQDAVSCGIELTEVFRLLGKRWSVTVVAVLSDGTSRFNGIRQAVPGISPKLLSERLRELEAAGVLERRVVASTPVSIEYVLTPKGRALRDVVDALQRWADDWVPEERPAPQAPDGVATVSARLMRENDAGAA